MNAIKYADRLRVFSLIFFFLAATAAQADDFLQFRGMDGRNVIATGKSPTEWSSEKNLAWKVEMPGRAVNGVIVVAGQVIATSSSGHLQDQLHIWSLDQQTGKPRWKRTVYSTGRAFCHPLSSMAAPTPASDGKAIYVLFATNDLVCLDLQGNLLWTRSLGMDFPGAFDDRGLASSPIVIEGTVIVQVACQGDSFVLGIDAATGQDKWRKDLSRITAWSSPTPFEIQGKLFALIHSAKEFQAIDPVTGDVRWQVEARGALIPSPAAKGQSVFLASAGLTRFDIDLNSSTPTRVWSEQKLAAGSACPVISGDKIYVIRGNNILTCGDINSGDVVWQLRLKASKIWATPLLIGDLAYVVNDAGMTQVVDVSGKKGKVVSENDLAEEMLGSPAYADGAIFLRGATHVFKVADRNQNGTGQPSAAKEHPQASVTEALKRDLQAALDRVVEREGFPGATLAVVLPDQQMIELASGWEDPENKLSMPVNAKMLVGSVGKTFVSAIALQLLAENKIALDDLAAQYFRDGDNQGWFARLPNSKAITIRSLLNHTSGLPRYIFTQGFRDAVKNEPLRKWKPQEQLEFIFDKPAVHPVGKGWAYSDTNYLILDLIIEQVTGNTFYDEAQQRILEPLGLTNTKPSDQPELAGLIPGYIGDNNFFSLPRKTVVDGKYVMDPSFEWCGGGFVSNSSDLARWLHQLHSGKVLTASLHDRLVGAVDLKTGEATNSGYGLGSFVWKTDLGMFWGHAGIMPGYVTQIEYSKEHRFSIAIQVNTDQGLGQKLHPLCEELSAVVVNQFSSEESKQSAVEGSDQKETRPK